MSSVYITEPPTRGKVLLKTSHGDIDVELWPKEAPKAVRNFVQLALEGYYDGLIFHRIIKSLMAQTGDPTGTGRGGDSVYGVPFSDELHSRLKFSHRGIVAMANDNVPNTNASQFFLTLGPAGWLDKKHTIFGKVTGNTIFNLLRLGEAETDRDDRPVDPPRLIAVEVLENPFDDVVPRVTGARKAAADAAEAAAAASRARRSTAKPASNLLSFGDEEEEGGGDGSARAAGRGGGSTPAVAAVRMVALHDAVAEEDLDLMRQQQSQQRRAAAAVSDLPSSAPAAAPSGGRPASSSLGKAGNVASDNSSGNTSSNISSSSSSSSLHGKRAREAATTALDDDDTGGGELAAAAAPAPDSEYSRLRAEVRALRGRAAPAAAAAAVAAAAVLDTELLTPLQQMRAKYKAQRKSTGVRESTTLEKLAAFTSTMRQAAKSSSSGSASSAPPAAAYSGQVLEDDEEEEEERHDVGTEQQRQQQQQQQPSWMSHKLKFKHHIDDKYREGTAVEDSLETIDPLRGQAQQQRGQGGEGRGRGDGGRGGVR